MKQVILAMVILSISVGICPQECIGHNLVSPTMKDVPACLDTNLTFQQCATALVSRMTLAEKLPQMQTNASAISRLGIPQYGWWNECLHGVAFNGVATVFP